jgi:hypothetical protein
VINPADLIGLAPDDARKAEDIDRQLTQTRQGIEAWHRLLDRRRSDRKLGLHPITEFVAAKAPASGEQGNLARRPGPEAPQSAGRAPFYVRSESEGRALLLHCIGYLANEAGEKLAFDKGYGERDKMAEWMMHEIEQGAVAYIRRHRPFVFGIPIAVADG